MESLRVYLASLPIEDGIVFIPLMKDPGKVGCEEIREKETSPENDSRRPQ